MGDLVIEATGLTMKYGDRHAVQGIDLQIERGECFAFLGPNGAGKTTTVEILEGFRHRTSGEVRVLGLDPGNADRAWRQRVGIVLQSCELEARFSVRETLQLVQPYYPNPLGVDEVVGLVGLEAAADQRAGKLSGGQQRRLDVGMALIGDPELLFLDEPTTGFDPSARRATWSLVSDLKALGKTVFLTTHYLEEAQALAGRVAIIRDGVLVAEGTPADLVAADHRTEIRFTLPPAVPASELPDGLGAVRADGHAITLAAEATVGALHLLTGWAVERGLDLPDLTVERPTLEDVYLELTEAADPAGETTP
jgi:ABC-2 type transport system ATP-binding protein